MQSSPLKMLVARHVCNCGRTQTALRPLTRAFISIPPRARNVPSPATFVGSAEELRRKYQPKPEEVDLKKLEYAQLRSRNRRATVGIILTTLAMFGTVYFWPTKTTQVKHDAPPLPVVSGNEKPTIEMVETGTSSVPTVPKTIYLAGGNEGNDAIPIQGEQEYQLVGLGIRTVSFLGIQVYVLAHYVNTQDLSKLQERLIRTQDPIATTLVPAEKAKLKEALLDAERGEDIWNAILKDGGIRSVFRIVPTRNTDFNHLRDGFLRGITGKSQHFAANKGDQEFSDEGFGMSVNDFKALFGAAPRKNLPKGEVLLLTRDAKGRLSAWYEDSKGARTKFGNIEDERISRLVWLQYLAGKNPSSESARQSVVDGCMEFVERPVGTVATQVV